MRIGFGTLARDFSYYLSLQVYDDIDFLDELKSSGYKVGIVTGGIKKTMHMKLEMVGNQRYDFVVRAQLSDGVRPKPFRHLEVKLSFEL